MKRQIVSYLIENNILVHPSTIQKLEDPYTLKKTYELVQKKEQIQKILEILESNKENKADNIKENEENNKKIEDEKNLSIEQKEEQKQKYNNTIRVIFDYQKEPIKKEVSHFTKYFNNRYKQIEKMLSSRVENNVSISRLEKKTDRETVSVIGMIADKQLTKTNKIILNVEDQTGSMKVIISPNKPDLFKMAKDLVLDETIGITGTAMNGLMFADKIVIPDLPVSTEIKKSPDEKYALFLADIHIGSQLFLEKEFDNFIEWLNGNYGEGEEKEIAKKTGYILIAGDLVAGVGIYPKQEDELAIPDIFKQYRKFVEYIKRIPKHIQVVIIPGNHDIGRLAEPQPKLERQFMEELYDLPNVFLLSNPSMVNIHSSEKFEGFNVLLYHGYSYDYYGDNVESIRMSGRAISDRTELISKFLLQRRHLAPTHESTLTIPDIEKDPLFIETIPDFFITGHIHKSAISAYRGTTIICSSCWEAQTSFQEKFGHVPDLAKVIAINLKTRKPSIIDFEIKKEINEEEKQDG